MYAVIKTGGKQYRVTPGLKLKVEKLAGEVGSNVVIDQVLMLADGDNVTIGAPHRSRSLEPSTRSLHTAAATRFVSSRCVAASTTARHKVIARITPKFRSAISQSRLPRHPRPKRQSKD